MKRIFNGFAIFLLAILVAVFGLKDIIIKNRIEKEMTKELGTKVEIYGVDYSIFKNFLEMKKIKIKNISFIEKVEANFNFSKILEKKIIVKNIEVKGLEFSRDRKEMTLKLGKLISGDVQKKLNEKKFKENVMPEAKSILKGWEIEVEKINLQVKLYEQEIGIKLGSASDSKIDFKKFVRFVKNNVIDEKN